ncbi:hypothetical protein DL765_001520 [Monosporascus sp. GIB2]|nr:hypothetical protein DL765_001520 [Monosporascus sp. GIB2]
MLTKSTLVAASLAALARAAQPEAPEPVAAPMRDLEWGEINFIHTTDTHGWHGGHLQESQYSADWGDYISFTHHMRKKADEKGVDLLVIDTGDRIEGNGLYDASDPKGKYTSDILKEQSIDIICTGNHELYKEESVAREHETTVPNFKGNYLASHLDYIEPETGNQIPQAQRYSKFTTKNRGYTIVAFGFLFDFDRNANNSVVQPVEEAIGEEWFQQAIREKPDLFVVTGHIGLRMKEFELIFKAIRDQNWYTPIAFFGGHAHVRDARRFDDKAFAIASGRYMETIGWMSIDGIKKKNGGEEEQQRPEEEHHGELPLSARKPAASPSFKRRYIDNNLFNLRHHAGLNATAFATEHGRNVTATITEARRALGLDHRFGCAPQDLWMTRAPYPSNESLFTWLEEQVLPDIVVNEARRDVPRLAILNTGAVRFDIFKGPFTRDSTFLVSPFTSGFAYVPDVAYPVASKVIQLLNKGGPVFGKAAALGKRRVEAEVEVQDEIEVEVEVEDKVVYKVEVEVEVERLREREEQEEDVPGMPDRRFLAIPELMAPRAHPPAAVFRARVADTGVQKPLGGGDDDDPPLVSGYTTTDDLGDDGDDAVHAPIEFFNVPNCIQAEIAFPSSDSEGDGNPPERVDLVFNDYVQPWIIPALKFSGGDYGDENVRPYVEGSFTDLLAGPMCATLNLLNNLPMSRSGAWPAYPAYLETWNGLDAESTVAPAAQSPLGLDDGRLMRSREALVESVPLLLYC